MTLFRKVLPYILLFSLFCSVTFAADNANLISYPPEKIMGFRGLDTRSTAPLVADGRAVDLLNVQLSSAFDLRKRYGLDTVNDATLDDYDLSSPAITGIFDAHFSDATNKCFVFLGDKLKYNNSGVWTEVGPGGVTITSDADYQWQCVMAYDHAVCTNDYDPPININTTPLKSAHKFTGLSDALTDAKAIAFFRNYLIVGNTIEGGTERPQRFRWGNVGKIETWSDDDFSDLGALAADEIVGFAEMYGDLYIFLKKSIWKASLVGGDDVFAFTKVIDGIGAISRGSIQLVQLEGNRSVCIFLDERKKVLVFDGISIKDIGAIIQPTLDSLNESRLQYAVATFDGENYYLSVTTSGNSENDTVYVYNTEIFEWSVWTQIDANAMAQVQESDLEIKTYVGNYDAIVYWLGNPDLVNDVDGAAGILDSTGTATTSTITGAQVLIDAELTSGTYTGAIVRITSGTASGEEQVIVAYSSTSITVATAFTTTPDNTSIYSIGDIDAYYNGKFYDMGNASREKSFLGMLFWGEEASSNEVDVSYAIDYGTTLGSETKDLSPASSSLWDSAIWDESVWSVGGNKLYTIKMGGFGNSIQPMFDNDEIDETFHLYGFNLLAIGGDTKQ